ncbi:hypothetical protein BH23BAC2_BH23BAC2_05500 [soil metagenome]
MRFLFLFFLGMMGQAQEISNPEIFLFDLSTTGNKITVSQGINISQNEGYDNQPSFYSDEILLFSKTREGQTDIAAYNIKTMKSEWVSNTLVGSEYSPQRITGTNDIAAVRLDTTGLQRLYRYDFEAEKNRVLLEDLKVGYFSFLNEDKLITSVLTETAMKLAINDLIEKTSKDLVQNVGRSLHRVPGSDLMSYTKYNDNNRFDIYLLDLREEEPSHEFLTQLPAGVMDFVWLDLNRILIGKESKLFIYNRDWESGWLEVADLEGYNLNNITRLSINPTGDKLSVAAEYNTVE